MDNGHPTYVKRADGMDSMREIDIELALLKNKLTSDSWEVMHTVRWLLVTEPDINIQKKIIESKPWSPFMLRFFDLCAGTEELKKTISKKMWSQYNGN